MSEKDTPVVEAIIDIDTWDAAQNLLARNRHDSRTRTNAKAPSLLAGLLFHEDGAPYRPRQTHKGGANIHYYLHPSGTLPAREIDSFVTDELIALLGRQAELCRVIGTDDPAQMDVAGAKAELTAAELKLRPRRDIVLQTVDKVTVGEQHISIAINRLGLRSLLTNTQASMQSEAGGMSETPHLITRAFQIKRCGHGRKLIIGQQRADDKSQPDPSLVRAIARAHAWFEDLTSGLSYKGIATRDSIDERLVARTIRLALLAPDITKAILEGREPRGFTSEQLVRIPRLPASWNEQRSLLGFD